VDSEKSKIMRFFFKTKNLLVNFYFSLKEKIVGVFKKNKAKNSGSKQIELDKKLIYSLSKSKIPNLRQIKYIGKFLNEKEVKIIKFCLVIIILNTIFLGYNFRKNHIQLVPIAGGEYTEGLIGTPKYINPIYASANDVDGDITRLIFSSLLKHGKEGELTNDLATEYSVSEDGKAYTISIREDAKWGDGQNLTVDDIIFTFDVIENPQYKSPLRTSFSGVTLEKVDDKTIKFILPQPYGAFPELLTFGILPQNLWLSISPESASLAEFNLKPVGSGPYKFKSLTKDKAGNIRSYSLIVNKDYYGEKPYLENINFKFFINFEEAVVAMNENQINGISYLPLNIKENLVSQDSLFFYQINFPQINAIFFNQKNNEILADKKVRQALAYAINKNEIISTVYKEEAYLIDGPILPNNFAYNKEEKKYKYNLEEAKKLLADAGWAKATTTEDDIIKAEEDKNSEDEKIKQEAETKLSLGAGSWLKKENKYLIINLTTVENENNIKTVEMTKNFWEKLGVKTNLTIVPVGEIQTNIIKSKNFEALFYGQVVGSDPDSYAFWHSSQTGAGGLNIANYTNKDVDKLLEDARGISNQEERIEKYKKFQEILTEDVPAIFMYSPFYIYVQNKKIKGFKVKSILSPNDRFANISEWYTKTGKKITW
jgi:peptide/nickel transport system substrate-binding protein